MISVIENKSYKNIIIQKKINKKYSNVEESLIHKI